MSSLFTVVNLDDLANNEYQGVIRKLSSKALFANTLIELPKQKTENRLMHFEDKNSIVALAEIRNEYFTSSGEKKLKAEKQFTAIQRKIFDFYIRSLNQEQRNLVGAVKKVKSTSKTVTQMLSEWEPFSNRQCEWFDPKWMFGIEGGFDVVIANPPYATLRGRTMTDQEEQSSKETKRKEKRIEEEAERLVKEHGRKKAYLAREQAIEEDQKKRGVKRAEKREAEAIKQSARDQARRKDTLTREQAIVEDQEARKLKDKEQTRE